LIFTLSLQNLLQPVNKLPPEIVFRIAQGVPHKYDEDAKSIIPLNHVCRYWRESIVSSPEHWTKIYSKRSNLAVLSLERAKAAPLDINLDLSVTTSAFFDLLTPYIQNTESCCVRAILAIEDLTRWLLNFPWSMPSLRALKICGPEGDWESIR